jgi:ssDNA-binding Zn-finger/Zn-ribbon topoisomerase 1
MARKTPKTSVVAFKVETELAELLNKLPNKSAFIRNAIAAQMGVTCPLCHGKGMVHRGVHDFYAPLLARVSSRNCEGCGHEMNVPLDPGALDDETRHRLEQFFLGGPLYCDGCYEKAPSCDDCGWHISSDRIDEHHRKAHHPESGTN